MSLRRLIALIRHLPVDSALSTIVAYRPRPAVPLELLARASSTPSKVPKTTANDVKRFFARR